MKIFFRKIINEKKPLLLTEATNKTKPKLGLFNLFSICTCYN